MADTSTQQYFNAVPDTQDERRTLDITIRERDYTVTVSNSVFSTHRLDPGTSVLLNRVPSPCDEDFPADNARTYNFLDLGCGWGPISLALAAESPSNSTIWALDVNERAVELTKLNAENAGFTNVRAGTAESFAHDFANQWADAHFDLIWSNPPIRIGKDALHELLMTYLPRLAVNGKAYMVVHKHLGADSLMKWLSSELNANPYKGDYTVKKFASAKGYRILEVTRIR